MAMENLSIVQDRDTLRYARIRSGAYWPQLRRFWQGYYVYFQCETPTILDVKAGRTILRVKEVLPSGLLLLEVKDGMECHNHFINCAPCHLPIEGTVHHELVVVPESLPCFVCGEKKIAATMHLEAIKDGAHTTPILQFHETMFTTLVGCGAILYYPYSWIGVGPSCLAGFHSQLRCQDVLFMCDLAMF